ncbi:MAG: DUF1786 domain-containing protein [Sphaerobacter sp.]|nr:DUF1786 domain-containing protein [Sphaerobacter sp.]
MRQMPQEKGLATMLSEPIRILAIDVGAGTQDILVYESDRAPENCVKLVLPSQTQVVAARIRRATARRVPIHLAGTLMGGGASSEAVQAHLAAGLPVTAAPAAARTLHNDLERVRALGVTIRDEPPPGAEIIRMGDIDLAAIETALARFEVPLPSLYAVAVQDHGYLPDAGGRELRYEFLQRLLERDGDVRNMVYRDPPPPMIRMQAVRELLPGAAVMDTGAAAVLGILGDPVVAGAVFSRGAILVNVGNMHTFGVALRGRRICGLFEHHTGGVTPAILHTLVDGLRTGQLTHEEVVALGGHGAAFAPDYADMDPIDFVAITGPNRALVRSLGYYEAVPHGDMMLSGPYGLVEGLLTLLASEGFVSGLSLIRVD